jgi:hypothetical protein
MLLDGCCVTLFWVKPMLVYKVAHMSGQVSDLVLLLSLFHQIFGHLQCHFVFINFVFVYWCNYLPFRAMGAEEITRMLYEYQMKMSLAVVNLTKSTKLLLKVIMTVNQRKKLWIQETATAIPQRKMRTPLAMIILLEEIISGNREKLGLSSRGKLQEHSQSVPWS